MQIEVMGLDGTLVKIGGFGRYQKKIFILLCLTGLPTAFFNSGPLLWAYTPDFYCKEAALMRPQTFTILANFSIPGKENITRESLWKFLRQKSVCSKEISVDQMPRNLSGIDELGLPPGMASKRYNQLQVTCKVWTYQQEDAIATVVAKVTMSTLIPYHRHEVGILINF